MFKKIKEFFRRLGLIESYIKEMQRIEDSIKFRISDLENTRSDIISLHSRLEKIEKQLEELLEK